MRLTLKQLQTIVRSYIDTSKVAVGWTATTNNLIGLVDKIGKQIQLDNSFEDNLFELDGDNLPLGKTIEEYYQDLVLPTPYDDSGANTMAPAYPTYRKPSYSYTFGRNKLKTTLKYNDYERACIDETAFSNMSTGVLKRLFDSENTYKFWCKKQLLKVAMNKIHSAYDGAQTFATSTEYEEGVFVENSGTIAVVMKKIESSNAKSFDTLVEEGTLIVEDLITTIARPVDTATGEAFIKQIKADVERAGETHEGHSLNGNTLGAGEGLVLYVDFGIMPSIDVDTLAGAFNQDKLAMPVQVKSVNCFAGATGKPFAMLVDARAIKLHNGYNATREQENADGDFINYVKHMEYTGFVSRNAFIKVYHEAE